MHEKHPTKTAACCNGNLFFMKRYISVLASEDIQVEINHYADLFGVKSRKKGIVEAVRANESVNC